MKSLRVCGAFLSFDSLNACDRLNFAVHKVREYMASLRRIVFYLTPDAIRSAGAFSSHIIYANHIGFCFKLKFELLVPFELKLKSCHFSIHHICIRKRLTFSTLKFCCEIGILIFSVTRLNMSNYYSNRIFYILAIVFAGILCSFLQIIQPSFFQWVKLRRYVW